MKEEWKRSARREMRLKLESLTGAARLNATRSVMKQVQRHSLFKTARVVGFYASIDWEIDLQELSELCLDSQRVVALPRWNASQSQFEFAVVDALEQLQPGRYGIMEPESECRALLPQELELVLVPGLAFSRKGDRLGRGAGYYDRLLKHNRGTRWGVCHAFQLVSGVPRQEWDVRMDAVITPDEWIEVEAGKKQ